MEIPKNSGRQTAPPRTSAGLVSRGELEEPTRIMAELDCTGASAGNKPNGEVDGESEFSGLDGKKRREPTQRTGGGGEGWGCGTNTHRREEERASGLGPRRISSRALPDEGGGRADGAGGRRRRRWEWVGVVGGVAGGVLMGPTGVWASNFESRLGGEEAGWWGPPLVICIRVVAWTWMHRSHNFSSQFV